MALYYDLKVFKDVYKLILLIFEYTGSFPREYKYTVGQDMERDAIQLVRNIYRANKAESKREYLEAFLDDFEVLRLEIRLCRDMKGTFHIVENTDSKGPSSGSCRCGVGAGATTIWADTV